MNMMIRDNRLRAYMDKAGKKKELGEFMDRIYVTGKATEGKHCMECTGRRGYAGSAVVNMWLDAKAKALREEKIMKKWEETDAMPSVLKTWAIRFRWPIIKGRPWSWISGLPGVVRAKPAFPA
jgi:hypothetical protein